VRSVELFDLMPPAEYLERVAERRRQAGDAKMATVELLDRELRRAAGLETAAWLHPAAMYARLRLAFARWQSPARLARLLDADPLPRPERFQRALPERYVVAKMYAGDCVPDTPEARHEAERIVAREAGGLPVVSLATEARVDDHAEWSPESTAVAVGDLEPATNLADQTRIVAHAERLIAPYGGFSYLGPFLGVPTTAIQLVPPPNTLHLEILRAFHLPGELRVVGGAE